MLALTAAERELESLDNVLKAAEKWSKQYNKDPESLAKLIKLETRLETLLRRYFKTMAEERAITFIRWDQYRTRLYALTAADDFTVEVLINDDVLGQEDKIVVQTIFDPIAQAIALGAQSGETVYVVELGISQTSATVQRTAREMVAELVGKKINKDGQIVNNPNPKYSITDKTRKDIRESISTSLSLGEDQADAVARLQKTIKNPKRAGVIARTEAVNAYGKGLIIMGQESGAVGKEWQSSNPDDICGTNASVGVIKLMDNFPSGNSAPAAHPNCRCGLRLVYPEDESAKLLKD